MSSKKPARISRAARKRIVELAREGQSPYAIARYLNGRRYRPPRGGQWFRTTVLNVMRQAGVYSPRPTPHTSAEAVALIVQLAKEGKSAYETVRVLEESGLRPAHGGAWKDATIRRIRERHGLESRRLSRAERFDKSYKHDPRTGCERWTSRKLDGYGLFEVEGRNVHAHRWAYEREHGPLPEGFHLHHTCRNTECVRVGHLLALSPEEHKATQRAEDELIAAIRSADLQAELRELAEDSTPDLGLQRVGALRPEEVPV